MTWDAFEGPRAPKIAPGCLTTQIFDDLGCLKPPVLMKKTRFYDGNVLSSFLLFLNRTEVFSSQLSSSAPALRIKPPQRGGLGEAHLDTWVSGNGRPGIYIRDIKKRTHKGVYKGNI